MLHGSLVGRGVWGRMDTCFVWLSSFAVHPDYHNIVNWLYPSTKFKKISFCKKCCNWDFLGGPEAKTTAPNAEDMSLIPGQETRSCVLELRHNAAKKINKQNKYFKSAIILIRSNKVVIQFKIKKLGGAIIYQMVKLWSYMIIKKNENNAIKCKKSSKQVIILLI